MTTNSIGFIGLGNMGLPMACNLAKAGYQVRGFDPQLTDKATSLQENITLHGSIGDAMTGSDLRCHRSGCTQNHYGSRE